MESDKDGRVSFPKTENRYLAENMDQNAIVVAAGVA
jgi:hypothetical protein